MIKRTTLILFIVFTGLNGFAQKKDTKKPAAETKKPEAAAPAPFDVQEATSALIKVLNKIRVESKLDSVEFNPILAKASLIQSEDMAKSGKADLSNSKGKYKTTEKRVVSVGGTNKAQELVTSVTLIKGKSTMSVQEFSDAVFFKWRTGKIPQSVIKNSEYLFASPSITLDVTGKKITAQYTRKNIVISKFSPFNGDTIEHLKRTNCQR